MKTKLKIPVDKPYDFISTLRSHGWVGLLPNIPNDKVETFTRAELLSSGQVVILHIYMAETPEKEIHVDAAHSKRLSSSDSKEVIARIGHMLRLDEDLGIFYKMCKEKGGIWKGFREGKGYLLRSPEIFEDIVKVICTTNIQWGGTKRMVRELVESLGFPYEQDASLRAFPAPESIASVTADEFKKRVRLGYRADYVYELATKLANGKLDLEGLKDPASSTNDTKAQLLAIKGIGNYAASSLLMLLGRYDQIPIDTVFREFMKAKHFQDKEFSEARGIAIYDEWGDWKYLAYWYEMLAYYYPKKELEEDLLKSY
jgi:3-methyladenine DNA glycosylase/8-oxoguanine DNA glycosylase